MRRASPARRFFVAIFTSVKPFMSVLFKFLASCAQRKVPFMFLAKDADHQRDRFLFFLYFAHKITKNH
jgi:hypothetical protein